MSFTLTIMPDYGGAYCWSITGDAEAHAGVGPCSCLPRVQKGMRKHPHPLEQDFEQWQSQFEDIPVGSFDGFDWEGFHREGIALSRKLKKSLGVDVRVVYEKAYEDPNNGVDERREILTNGSLKSLASRNEVNALARSAN